MFKVRAATTVAISLTLLTTVSPAAADGAHVKRVGHAVAAHTADPPDYIEWTTGPHQWNMPMRVCGGDAGYQDFHAYPRHGGKSQQWDAGIHTEWRKPGSNRLKAKLLATFNGHVMRAHTAVLVMAWCE